MPPSLSEHSIPVPDRRHGALYTPQKLVLASQQKGGCALPELASCPLARAAAIVGSRWTLLILRELSLGSRRFGELQSSLAGISPKTLSERLKTLERQGVVRRSEHRDAPVRVSYELTAKGIGLLPVLDSLRIYGETYL